MVTGEDPIPTREAYAALGGEGGAGRENEAFSSSSSSGASSPSSIRRSSPAPTCRDRIVTK